MSINGQDSGGVAPTALGRGAGEAWKCEVGHLFRNRVDSTCWLQEGEAKARKARNGHSMGALLQGLHFILQVSGSHN